MFSAINPSKWSRGQPTLQHPGSSWGFGALLKGLTAVVDTSCRSRDSNPQPWVSSPTLYPLGHYCPHNEYFIRPIKKTFLVNCWSSGEYVNLLYMYSILSGGSFCFNYCLNSAWHGGDQFVALLRWCEAQVSLTVAFIDSLCSGLVSLLASQAHQHHAHLTNFWCFWQCGQEPNPAGK